MTGEKGAEASMGMLVGLGDGRWEGYEWVGGSWEDGVFIAVGSGLLSLWGGVGRALALWCWRRLRRWFVGKGRGIMLLLVVWNCIVSALVLV